MISGSISMTRGGGRVGGVSGSGPISGSMQLPSVLSHQQSHSASGEGPSRKRNDAESGAGEGKHERSIEEEKPTVVVSKYLETVWESDADLVRLRHLVNDDFRKLWKEGMIAYIKGDWSKALAIFKETLRSSDGEDGPSRFLVSVIEEHGGMSPRDWEGYREG